jgi:uncharacterized pyridoxal phosphate-containing UPF0001 family protein
MNMAKNLNRRMSAEVTTDQVSVSVSYDERKYGTADDVQADVLAQVTEALRLVGLEVAITKAEAVVTTPTQKLETR